jgi:dTDP-4-dehydrorhamnose reductase
MLGRALVRRFSDAGFAVTGVDRDDFDVTDREAVDAGVGSVSPGLVVHAAAFTDVDGCETAPEEARRVHVDGSRNVARAARVASAALLAVSTDYVFSGDSDRPRPESDAPNPRSVYGRTKLEGEGAVWLEHPSPVIARTCGLYGEGGRHFPRAIRSRIEAGAPLEVVDDQTASPTYVEDLAAAIVELGTHRDVSGVYHIVNRGAVTWCEIAREIARVLGKPDHPVTAISSDTLARPAPRPTYSALDPAKVEAVLGRPMREWQLALGEFMNG